MIVFTNHVLLKLLQNITSASRVFSATVTSMGSGSYAVGDSLTVLGGMGSAATLRVASVGILSATIVGGGSSYLTNDVLTVIGECGTQIGRAHV